MTYLSRDDILKAPDLITEDVEVPEWGGTVRVKALTGAERDRLESSVISSRPGGQRNLNNIRARMVALAVVDADGKTIFQAGDIEALGEKSAAALDRVFGVAQRLAGMSEKDIEELTGNFTAGQNGASTSA